MDWIDLGLIGYLILGAFYGLRRGLVWVGFSLVGYIVGVLVADRVAKPLTTLIVTAAPIHRWIGQYLPQAAARVPGARLDAWHLANSLVSLLVFLLVVGAAEFVGRTIGTVASQGVNVFRVTSFLNRILGVAVGLLEHGVVAGLVLSLALAIPAIGHSSVSQALHKAPLAGSLIGLFSRIAKVPGGRYL